jgi:F-type H+-transporting ATPase subunit c
MNVEVAQQFAVAGAIAIGALGPAIAIGLIAASGLNAIGRNPDAENAIRNNMVLGLAFAESLAIFSLVIALIIRFVK